MKLKAIFFLLSLTNYLVSEVPEVQTDPQYNFVLLAQYNSKHYMASFPLEDIKKCRFPEGPLRAHTLEFEDFQAIDEATCHKLQNIAFLRLQPFCIEDGVPYKSPTKKCGFGVPGEPKLHYVFCIKEDIKDVSGYIILRSQFEQEISLQELSFEEQIDDPDLEINAQTRIEDEPKSLTTKVSNYSRLLLAVLYIQYLKIKDYLGYPVEESRKA